MRRQSFSLTNMFSKHVTHNESLALLDGIVQINVLERDLTAPPGSPVKGAVYIVAADATGAWDGWDGDLALFSAGAWIRIAAREGVFAWLADEGLLLRFTGSAWVEAHQLDLAKRVFQIHAAMADGRVAFRKKL